MNAQEVRPQALENRKNFTIRELKRADRFLQLINLPSRQTERVPTQVLHICGTGRPTLAKAILLRDPEENTGRLLFDENGLRNSIPELTADLLLEEGDGSLTLESTSLPQALQENFHRPLRQGLRYIHPGGLIKAETPFRNFSLVLK